MLLKVITWDWLIRCFALTYQNHALIIKLQEDKKRVNKTNKKVKKNQKKIKQMFAVIIAVMTNCPPFLLPPQLSSTITNQE